MPAPRALNDEPGGLSYNAATSSGVGDLGHVGDGRRHRPATRPARSRVATTSFGTPTGGDHSVREIQDAVEPGLQLRYRLSEQWTAGSSVTAPFGLGTKYRDDWAGRYYAIESKLITVNAAPSIAYQSRAGADARRRRASRIRDRQALERHRLRHHWRGELRPGSVPGTQDGKAEFTPIGWAFGYHVGASLAACRRTSASAPPIAPSCITSSKATSISRSIQRGIGAALSGVSGAFVDTEGRSKVTLPAVAALGAAYDVTPQLSLMAEFDYTWWSSFDELRVKFANPFQPDSFQTYDYKNTYFASARSALSAERGLGAAHRHRLRPKPDARCHARPAHSRQRPQMDCALRRLWLDAEHRASKSAMRG